MDLVIVPLRLELAAYAEMCPFIIGCFDLYRGVIWSYKLQTLEKRILTIGNEGKDMSPPTFDDNGEKISSRYRRDASNECELSQIPGRDPTDTAFKLRATVSDDITEAKLHFKIGTSPGTADVVDWTEMGGSLLVYAVELPNSVPLYWTLRATNNQGTEAFKECMLNTYDNTVPDGRVDPSYVYSSHPDTLSGTVTVFDDSTLMDTHLVALGYSPGQFGSEVVDWQTFSLSGAASFRSDIASDLKHFSEPKPGRLAVEPFTTHKEERAKDCATKCLGYDTKCVSFDYDYETEECALHNYVEGPSAKLKLSSNFVNYERIGIGKNEFISYSGLPLVHGTSYFINAVVSNTLNYTGVMHSIGTMVDFSPPDPGYLGTYYTEEYRADSCSASKDQVDRCVNVTPLKKS